MEATVGGSSVILLNPSLEAGRGEEKNLNRWRLKYPWEYKRLGRDKSKNLKK